jgi:hypothetical protein
VIQPHLGQDFETRKPRVPVTELKDVYYLPLSPGAKKIIVSFSLPLFDYFFKKLLPTLRLPCLPNSERFTYLGNPYLSFPSPHSQATYSK